MPSKRAKHTAIAKSPRPSAGYSKRSLSEKLGIKAAATKAILEAPEGFHDVIGTATFDRSLELESYDYLHFFAHSKRALEHVVPILAKRLNRGGALWISWPKKASGKQTDLAENVVREIGLATGLVDVKVCAIDETWSGLKFLRRNGDPT